MKPGDDSYSKILRDASRTAQRHARQAVAVVKREVTPARVETGLRIANAVLDLESKIKGRRR